MQNRLLAGAAVAVLATLAACRTVPTAAPSATPLAPPWAERRPQLQARELFTLRGRVAVATGEQGFNASLRWTQDGKNSALTLAGPFGMGGFEIDADGPNLDVITPSGEHIASDAARAELTTHLGFDPPVTSLRYWVLGVPDPAQPSTETVDQAHQRLSGLEQQGWRVNYTSYVVVGDEWLPSRLTLERANVRVRLLVDDWRP
ncbi:MAG: lipoprotein insertase outer membrane protein LolB [Steroidobacteraceae bacterium]